jgi:hypothetical protein
MSTLTIGSMNQLADVFEREGYSAELVTKLRSNTLLLKQIKSILNGDATLERLNYVIDTDVEPRISEGCTIEEHKTFGKIEWDLSKAKLFLPKRQKNGGSRAMELRREIMKSPVLNATVLDYLLLHPEIIPDEWKTGCICFWGTIYRDHRNTPFVRYMFYGDKGGWHLSSSSLYSTHTERHPIAIFR